MPPNTPPKTDASNPVSGYGTGFIVGVVAGLALYGLYGTKTGSAIRSHAPSESSLSLAFLQAKIAHLKLRLAPFLLHSAAKDGDNQKKSTPAKITAGRRYFKSKKTT
jgi:hypothetical protein